MSSITDKWASCTWSVAWGIFAGDEAGTVVVSIEYPSLSALAADDEKMRTNAEIAAWLKGLDKVRKVVSDSIYREL